MCSSSSRGDSLNEFQRQCREIVERVSTLTATQSSAGMDVRIWVAYISTQGCIGETEEAKKVCEKTLLALCQGLSGRAISGSMMKQLSDVPVSFAIVVRVVLYHNSTSSRVFDDYDIIGSCFVGDTCD